MTKDFLHITDLTADEIRGLFDLAAAVKAKFKARQDAGQAREDYRPLHGYTLAMIFAKPSVRTRISFETGFYRRGGHALYLDPDSVGIGKREAVKALCSPLSQILSTRSSSTSGSCWA